MPENKAIVVGAGLAGCEAAWQLARRGIEVTLYEMKPVKFTPAHHYEGFAELVCSNSLRAADIQNAIGLLKEELRILGSLIMQCADSTRVPAGGALAVDRSEFSNMVTRLIKSHPGITVECRELTSLPKQNAVIATGPLTTPALFENIKMQTGSENLYFYDAAAPIITHDSIDFEHAFIASRYDKGEADYINCPMTRDEYLLFWNELTRAECAKEKDIDKNVFEGCMPVEVMARRGEDTLRYGPLKPVGLIDPATGKQPYAVVQLRRDNKEGSLYNIVGFQTHLKWGEQQRVFGLIPALANAHFERFGVMHRNTYLNSPALLSASYAMKGLKNVFFAGQMTGVEGYVESVSSGFLAGVNLARRLSDKPDIIFPNTTAIGSLAAYISGGAVSKFQPMNASFGLMQTKDIKNKKERNLQTAKSALTQVADLSSGL